MQNHYSPVRKLRIPRAGQSAAETAGGDDWRRATRSKLLWLLLAKLAALMLLWFLFFSPAHRQRVDGETASSHFAVSGAPPTSKREGSISLDESKETNRD